MSAPRHGVSRRMFLRAATVGAAAAAIPVTLLEHAGAATGAARATGAAGAAATMTRSAFAPHLRQSFRVRTADGRTFQATLVEISDLVGASTAGEERRFSLLFRAQRHPDARHGVHQLGRAGFGSLDLFVVPVGRGVDHQHYQAVVNRPA
jgi:hypothetical protein